MPCRYSSDAAFVFESLAQHRELPERWTTRRQTLMRLALRRIETWGVKRHGFKLAGRRTDRGSTLNVGSDRGIEKVTVLFVFIVFFLLGIASGGNRELPQAQPPVVGRNLQVPVDSKTIR